MCDPSAAIAGALERGAHQAAVLGGGDAAVNIVELQAGQARRRHQARS
jgi:hypothetical protein